MLWTINTTKAPSSTGLVAEVDSFIHEPSMAPFLRRNNGGSLVLSMVGSTIALTATAISSNSVEIRILRWDIEIEEDRDSKGGEWGQPLPRISLRLCVLPQGYPVQAERSFPWGTPAKPAEPTDYCPLLLQMPTAWSRCSVVHKTWCAAFVKIEQFNQNNKATSTTRKRMWYSN